MAGPISDWTSDDHARQSDLHSRTVSCLWLLAGGAHLAWSGKLFSLQTVASVLHGIFVASCLAWGGLACLREAAAVQARTRIGRLVSIEPMRRPSWRSVGSSDAGGTDVC